MTEYRGNVENIEAIIDVFPLVCIVENCIIPQRCDAVDTSVVVNIQNSWYLYTIFVNATKNWKLRSMQRFSASAHIASYLCIMTDAS